MTMHSVRTTVNEVTFDGLTRLASESGLTLAAYVRQVLTGHVASTGAPPDVTAEDWSDFREWVKANPGVLHAYTGDRHWSEPTSRRAVVSWAIAFKGYRSPL